MTKEEGPSAEESLYDATQASPFQPFEPEIVQPTSTVPPPVDPEDVGDTSGEDETAASDERKPEEPELPQFDPKHREPFEGLLYLGRLQKEFSHLGHQFVIRTLTTEELAEIALLTQPYENTRANNVVYQTAVVAASVVSLDGQPLVQPLGNPLPLRTELEQKFRYVMRAWMPPVREKVFNEVFELEGTVREVIEEMGKVSG